MCDYGVSAVIASLAIAAASAVVNDQSQQAQARSQRAYAEAQIRAQNEASERNAQEAIKEQINETAAARTQQMQEQQAAANEIQKSQTEMLQKRGTALASSNAAGNALDALWADYERQDAVNRDTVKQQLEMQGVGHDFTVNALRDRADGRISSHGAFIPAPIAQPNRLATGLGFLSDSMSAYGKYSDYGKNNPWGSTGKTTPKTRGVFD